MAEDRNTTALRCPSCGASGAVAGSNCGYCGSKLMTVTCSGCLGQMFEGSRYCPHCGAEGAIVSLAEDVAGAGPCPRCSASLGAVNVGGRRVDICPSCNGTWISAATLDQICSDREAQIAITGLLKPGPTATPESKVRYLKCPACSALMSRKNYALRSGVIMDICAEHGIWLDRNELRQILEFIRNGGLDLARTRQIEEIKRESAALDAKRWDTVTGPHVGNKLPDNLDPELTTSVIALVLRLIAAMLR